MGDSLDVHIEPDPLIRDDGGSNVLLNNDGKYYRVLSVGDINRRLGVDTRTVKAVQQKVRERAQPLFRPLP
jgi:hypothetical protein